MITPSLYLAGPITGCSWEGATDWRSNVSGVLEPYGIKCLSPLRGKQYLLQELSIADRYDQHVMSTAKAIFARDMFDVERTTGLFVNLIGAKKVSIGTVMEISFAWSLRHPVIIVMEKDNIHHHSMLEATSGWVVEDINEGIEIAKKIFLP